LGAANRDWIDGSAARRREHSMLHGETEPVLSGWRDIDTAPQDGTHVLAWDVTNDQVTIAVYLEGSEGWNGWYQYGDLLEQANLSHWMPLPPRP
jgi:hypothetical protein